ncbi:MAG TPA: ABC transporter ATP-binding protein [Bacillota bacterium]|jgi:multiple sugar transport system ATP-binding protein
MARVVLESVTKKFGETTAVDAVSLEIRDHEFMVLVGPSGCGKSTTLRMVAGLEEVTDGGVYIGDRRVNDVAPKDRDIAMVFQNYALYPHMNVYENMAFGLKLRRVPKAEIDRRVREAAQTLGLGGLLARRPRELSGGQKQRAALGRAIVREPVVFLMDEPLSNLDAKLRVQMRAEIIQLHHRLETTVIYVTHDQTEAMTMGDRIAVMKDGRIHQVAPPREIYEHPANMFVAGFIGTPPMNFLNCRVAGDQLVTGDATLPIPAGRRAGLRAYDGGQVVLGLRPEDVSISPGQLARPGIGVIEGRVSFIEPLGAEVIVHLATGDQALTARVPPDGTPSYGQSLPAALRLDRCHLFDPGSELAIR